MPRESMRQQRQTDEDGQKRGRVDMVDAPLFFIEEM